MINPKLAGTEPDFLSVLDGVPPKRQLTLSDYSW